MKHQLMPQKPEDDEWHNLSTVLREITDVLVKVEDLMAELAFEKFAEGQRLWIEKGLRKG